MADIKVPWESEDCFPEKPLSSEYGYLSRGKLVGCSREELIRCCDGSGQHEVDLVWHPDAPRVVPASTVPFLQEALKRREKKRLKEDIGINGFMVLLFGVMAWSERGNLGYLMICLFLGAVVGVWPLFQNLRFLYRFEKLDWATASQDVKMERYSVWMRSRPVRFTWVFLGTIILVFAVQYIRGEQRSILAAGLVKELVREGEWWRLFTAPLLHGHLLHLVLNGAALIGLGRLIEVLGSRFHLAFVFALSAIAGSVFSLFSKPYLPSVGASGGLLGLIGFLLVMGYRRRTVLPPDFGEMFAMNILLTAAMGYVAQSIIDNAAHLGGLVCGMALGLVMVRGKEGNLPLTCRREIKILGTMAVIGVLGFAGFAIWKMLQMAV